MSKKIEAFWVNATAFEVARVMAGETVEARFRDDEGGKWLESDHSLGGYDSTEEFCKWISSTGCPWRYCQVYREPSWYANKPDPGPGWRLLEKFPDEELKPGDEGWDVWNDGEWAESDNANGGKPQSEEIWYRRRIEPVEPKFAVGQTVKVVGPKEKPALHWGKEMDCQIGFTGVIRNDPLYEDGERFYNLEGIGIWCFREDYLEPVEPVEPDILHYVLLAGESAKLPNGQTITITEKGFEVTQ
jgi:hypothetical protein